jgi:hypothetical protein
MDRVTSARQSDKEGYDLDLDPPEITSQLIDASGKPTVYDFKGTTNKTARENHYGKIAENIIADYVKTNPKDGPPTTEYVKIKMAENYKIPGDIAASKELNTIIEGASVPYKDKKHAEVEIIAAGNKKDADRQQKVYLFTEGNKKRIDAINRENADLVVQRGKYDADTDAIDNQLATNANSIALATRIEKVAPIYLRDHPNAIDNITVATDLDDLGNTIINLSRGDKTFSEVDDWYLKRSKEIFGEFEANRLIALDDKKRNAKVSRGVTNPATPGAPAKKGPPANPGRLPSHVQ